MQVSRLASLTARNGEVFAVLSCYELADQENSVGQISVAVEGENLAGTFRCALNTNDDLEAIWCSPAGHLWCVSKRGNVWTSAPVSWPGATTVGLSATPDDSRFTWSSVTVAKVTGDKGYADLQFICGSSDDDVHVFDVHGQAFHWNGSRWSQTQALDNHRRVTAVVAGEELFTSLARPDSGGGLLFRWDGTAWSDVALPNVQGREQPLVDAIAQDVDGSVVAIAGRQVLRGNRERLSVVGTLDELARSSGLEAPVRDLGTFAGAVYWTGPAGLGRVVAPATFVLDKPKVTGERLFATRERLYAIDPLRRDEQGEPDGNGDRPFQRPTFVRHDPADKNPWGRFGF